MAEEFDNFKVQVVSNSLNLYNNLNKLNILKVLNSLNILNGFKIYDQVLLLLRPDLRLSQYQFE